MKTKIKRKRIHAWQAKQKKAGRVTLTFFCEKWIKDKIFARATAKDMSVADYLNKYLPTMWNKKGLRPTIVSSMKIVHDIDLTKMKTAEVGVPKSAVG